MDLSGGAGRRDRHDPGHAGREGGVHHDDAHGQGHGRARPDAGFRHEEGPGHGRHAHAPGHGEDQGIRADDRGAHHHDAHEHGHDGHDHAHDHGEAHAHEDNGPGHGHDGEHGHSHDHLQAAADPALLSTERGVWALKLSFAGLLATAVFQVFVVAVTGSVALLADTIHNFGDAATAIPLYIAFRLGQQPPSRRFTYGLGRVEDLAGVAIVLIILLSAAVAGYEAVDRLLHPRAVEHLWAVVAASVIGFLGNEAVAVFRIRTGREIGSAALVADGHHARVDGLTSLAVLLGALGVWAGWPLADPLVGLAITVAILGIVRASAAAVLERVLDGVDPEVVGELEDEARRTPGVAEVADVRARWLGHRLHAELDVGVDPSLSVAEGHAVAAELRHRLLHRLRHLSGATVHVDPAGSTGERHHRVEGHDHDGLGAHAH